MSTRVTVLHVTSRLNVGGLARLVLDACDALDRSRFDCRLVTGRVGPSEGDLLAVEGRQTQPIVIPELGRNPHPWRDVIAARKLAALIRVHRPAVVHTHAAKAGTLGRLAARLSGVPVCVHSYHGHVFQGYFSPMASRAIVAVERGLARLTSAIAVPGESQRQEIATRYRIAPARKVRVVPYGIDVGFFGQRLDRLACRCKLSIPADCRVIGSVGRMAPVKNHRLLIESFARLTAQPGFDDVHLLIVGDGECRQDIEAQVAALPAADRVRFVGWLADLREAYSAIDVLALTSFNEGMPVAVMEAMAAGVPVVSTLAGGVVDLVQHEENGLLATAATPEGFAHELARVLQDADLRRRLAARAREVIETRHTTQAHALALATLYEELLASA